MGLYLFRCNNQRFKEIFDDYSQAPRGALFPDQWSFVHRWVNVWAGNEQAGLLSLRQDLDKGVRIAYRRALVIGIAASELLTLILPLYSSPSATVNPLLLITALLWIL